MFKRIGHATSNYNKYLAVFKTFEINFLVIMITLTPDTSSVANYHSGRTALKSRLISIIELRSTGGAAGSLNVNFTETIGALFSRFFGRLRVFHSRFCDFVNCPNQYEDYQRHYKEIDHAGDKSPIADAYPQHLQPK